VRVQQNRFLRRRRAHEPVILQPDAVVHAPNLDTFEDQVLVRAFRGSSRGLAGPACARRSVGVGLHTKVELRLHAHPRLIRPSSVFFRIRHTWI